MAMIHALRREEARVENDGPGLHEEKVFTRNFPEYGASIGAGA
jgi:hypothetical protein